MDEMLNRLRPDLSRRSDSNLLTLVPTSIADASRFESLLLSSLVALKE